MLACRSRYHSDPLILTDAMKDDLEELFGGDEGDIFRGVDLSSLDIDDVDLSVFSSYDSEDECESALVRELRNHDCMWGGQCCNKEFQRTQVAVPKPVSVPTAVPAVPNQFITHRSLNKVVTIQKCSAGSDRTENVVVVTKSVRTPVVKSEGRSLLLNRTTQPQPQPLPQPSPVKRELLTPKRELLTPKRELLTPKRELLTPKREILTPQSSRPDTPQSLSESEDDLGPIPIDPHNTTSIFRSALDALSSSDAVWEDNLCLFRTKDERVPSHTDIMRISATAKSDHNYDGSSKNVCLEGLGVDTPSDSEEEIDVVSLSERSSSSRSSSCSGGLPTRPTPRDQEHLEEITTSLLSASEAVSRKLKKTITSSTLKRKKYQSESSEEDDSEDDDDDDDDMMDEQMVYSSSSKHHHRQTKRQKHGGSQSRRRKVSRFGEEEDSQEKRDLHNNMERMRRIDLRNSFEELKALVPTVANKDRAAKVVILREAANYCDDLGADSQSKYMQLMALRKEQERLRAMVSSLRKAAAMACVKTPKRF